jgi:uncharacterized protein YodC (DUF2158 family)
MTKCNVSAGDVVQLRSGGREFTVTSTNPEGTIRISSMSDKGLLQETTVHPNAVKVICKR